MDDFSYFSRREKKRIVEEIKVGLRFRDRLGSETQPRSVVHVRCPAIFHDCNDGYGRGDVMRVRIMLRYKLHEACRAMGGGMLSLSLMIYPPKMTEPTRSFSIPRRPVSRTSTPALALARSHSTLWRPWSPKLPSFTEYERSIYKFPWLDSVCNYEDLEGGYAVNPHEDHHEGDNASQEIKERILPVEEDPDDPNLVRTLLIHYSVLLY